jgi:hypothetical protein
MMATEGYVMAFNLSSWFHRRQVQTQVQFAGRAVQNHRVTNPYHAVSIKAGPYCQRTAQEYGKRRYLSREAPPLPQPTCDTRNCSCRYLHHDDRRTGQDRRLRDVWDPASRQAKGGDRRQPGGRRVTDH